MTKPAAPKPEIKGWCPGAHRPMMSGDGLVFRVRPFFGELSVDQAFGLCDLADRFGNGILDLTSRANLQIRGVCEKDQATLLKALDDLELIDSNPAAEGRRNILIAPHWEEGDLTHQLCRDVLQTLPDLPDLPEKMGFAIDTGAVACLSSGSADFRFELTTQGHVMLRADGAQGGRVIPRAEAMRALTELALWFVQSGGSAAGRMARHLERASLPEGWDTATPRPEDKSLDIGPTQRGTVLGAPFGKIASADLRAVLRQTEVASLRLMLGRTLLLRGAFVRKASGFVTAPSRLMDVHACPGAPYCAAASVETMPLALALAPLTVGSLHVSGCSKGCAYPKAAMTTLGGRDGRFDLVRQGRPWDEPCQSGLGPDEVKTMGDLG